MKEENRIVELLSEMLKKFDNHDDLLKILVDGQNKNNIAIEKLIDSQNKTNLAIGELRLSNLRLAEGQIETNKTLKEIKVAIKDIARLDERVKKLEKTVFKQ